MSLEIVKRTPSIFWFQDRLNVILDVHIQNLNKDTIIIKENHFSINNDTYSMQFPFFENINDDEVEYRENENYLRIIVKKENEENFWKYLSKNNLYKNNIKVNWDNWCDEDDEEDEMDMEQMMSGMMPPMDGMMPPMDGMMPGMEGMMPGMNGMMPGMEGMEDFESGEDDDTEDNTDENTDIPDLENTEDDTEDDTDVPDLESTEDNNE